MKTAAAPAPKKYPSPPRPNFAENIRLARRDRNFRENPLDCHARNFRKISVPSEPSELSGNINSDRRIRNFRKISVSFAVSETFGKYPPRPLTRNFREIPPSPAYPKLSGNTPSPAYPKLSGNTPLARLPETFGKYPLDRLPETFGKYPSRSPCTRAEIFHVILYVITNSYYIIPYPPCFGARREL